MKNAFSGQFCKFDNGIGNADYQAAATALLALGKFDMKTMFTLSAVDRTLLAGLILLTLATETSARSGAVVGYVSDIVGDTSQGNYTPGYYAERLGVSQKSTALPGVSVREKSGKKIGRLSDVLVDLRSGRVLCGVVSASGATLALPGKAFFSADEKEAKLAMNDLNVDAVPRPNGSDVAAVMSSLPQAYSYFHQQTCWDARAQIEPRKCSEIVGLNVRNEAGESLGHVINVMVDLPTARVIFVVINFDGKGTDYVVPPKAFRQGADSASLVLNVDKSKIVSLAHSDGFFWSNMADVNWCSEAYRAFGEQADFDTTGVAAQASSQPATISASTQAVSLEPKNDGEIVHDILAAMMLDDVNNPIIFKHTKIKPANGQVTLTGWVKNENQHSKLLAIVASVAGAGNVHDELQVK